MEREIHVWTTLRELRDEEVCEENEYAHLRQALGRRPKLDMPIDLVTILNTNGLDNILDIPRNIVHGDHIDMRYRLFAVACAQDALYLMQDKRSIEVVKAAHLAAYEEANESELTAAWDDARAAARAAARAIAHVAVKDAVGVAGRAAAWTAAWTAVRNKQSKWFHIIFSADLDD